MIAFVLRRTRLTGLTLIGAACLALVFGIMNPGQADAAGGGHVTIDIAGHSGGFTADPVGPLVDTAGLVPGRTTSATMGVRNGFDLPSDLVLRLINVSDNDNTCTPAETVAEPGCGAAQGELGGELVFTVSVSPTENGTYVEAWTGPASQIESGVAVASNIAAGTAKWLRFDAGLPTTVGNDVQTDTFGFGVRVVLQNSSGIAGVSVDRNPGTTHSSSGHDALNLPFTGTRVALLFGAGMLALLGGLVLLAGARMRRRDAHG